MEKTLAQVTDGATIANVIRYALNRWDGLVRFLDDGRIEIDSNTVERAMCPVCSEQKKCVIRWQRRRQVHWAMPASLIETCKLHGANP
jgi:transposase